MNELRPQPDAELPPGITPEQGELLSAYLDGELAGTDLARAEKLLADSSAAREAYAQLAELSEDLSLFKMDQPRLSPEVSRNILTQWQAFSTPRPVRRSLVRWFASAAAAAALVGGFFLLNRPPAKPPATPSLGVPLAAAPNEALRRNQPETPGLQLAFADQREKSNLDQISARQNLPPAPAAPLIKPETLHKLQSGDEQKNTAGEPKRRDILPTLAMTTAAPRPDAGIRRLKVHVNPGDSQKMARLDAELEKYRAPHAAIHWGADSDRTLTKSTDDDTYLSPAARPALVGGARSSPAKGPAPAIAKEETRQTTRGQAQAYTLRMTRREANELERRLANLEPQDRLGAKLASDTRETAQPAGGAGQGGAGYDVSALHARKAGTDKKDQARKEEQLEAKDSTARTAPGGADVKPKPSVDQPTSEKAKDKPLAEGSDGGNAETAGAKPFGGVLKNAPTLADSPATQPHPTNHRQRAPGQAAAPTAQRPVSAAASQPAEAEEMVTVIIELVPIADNQQP